MQNRISLTLVNAVVEFAFNKGVNIEPPKEFCGGSDLIDESVYKSYLDSILNKLDSDNIGLLYAKYLNLGSLGLIYQISLEAKNLKQAIVLLQDYIAVNFPVVSISVEQDIDGLNLELISNNLTKKQAEFIKDSTLAIIYREMSLMMDEKSIGLTVPENKVDLFKTELGCDVKASSKHQIIIKSKDYNISINDKRLKVVENLLPKYLEMLEEAQSNNTFASRVKRATIRLCDPYLPNIETVSEQFAVSHRTLQRRLKDENTSFIEVVTSIKKDIHKYLTIGGSYKTKEVAYIMGYSSSSAYLHAVGGW